MPPQLEKNHVVPTAWQDEALARDGAFIHRVALEEVTGHRDLINSGPGNRGSIGIIDAETPVFWPPDAKS